MHNTFCEVKEPGKRNSYVDLHARDHCRNNTECHTRCRKVPLRETVELCVRERVKGERQHQRERAKVKEIKKRE